MDKRGLKVFVVTVCVVLAVIFFFSAVFTVTAGSRAILFTFGEITSVKSEGLHFKIPIVQTSRNVDIRTQKISAMTEAGSKNLQTIRANLSVNYRLNSSKLREIYSEVGLDIEEKIVLPRINETLKAVVAQYTAEELLTKRSLVNADIQKSLTGQLERFNIVLEGVQIINFDYSAQFNSAIEEKMVAEQRTLTEQNKLERVKYEAEQKLVQARAEAEVIQIQASAIKAQGGKEFIELKAIEKWNGVLPTYMGSGAVPFVNVGGK